MRVVAVEALGQFVPLYPLYPLLFAAHGLSDAAISGLFVLWSLTGLLLEVPSGAWADATSRRRLLALSAVLAAAAFALWVLLPGPVSFAAGFVLWGVATALSSGTLEALVHDALTTWDATDAYAGLMGRARAGNLVAILLATALGAPLVAVGGYVLPGLVGSAALLVSAVLALGLPEVRPDTAAADPDAADADDEDVGLAAAWWAMLRAGLAEVSGGVVVRRAVVVAAVFTGLLAVDEYLPLVAADGGATAPVVALLLAGVGVAEAIGAALGGRGARARPRTLGLLLVAAAVLVAVGVLLPAAPGFAAVAAGWGVLQMLLVVVDARVQDAVRGEARATVTSVAGFGSETVAIAVIGAVGLGSVWVALPVLVAAAAVPLLGVAGLLISDDGRH